MEDFKPDPKSFTLFITGIMAEGLISLGAMEHPITKKTEKNITHAGYIIDTLDMLKEKTSGNLPEDEAAGLEEAIHQLRILYLAESSKKEEPQEKVQEEKEK